MGGKRNKMTYKLIPQIIKGDYKFENIEINDIEELATAMLDSLEMTCEYAGETLEDIVEEIQSVVGESFAPFMSDASYQIRQGGKCVSAVMVSYYDNYPLISEIFTKKQYQHLAMATSLIKKSINSLLDMGYEELTLYVNPNNTEAINLYNKIGFKREDAL